MRSQEVRGIGFLRQEVDMAEKAKQAPEQKPERLRDRLNQPDNRLARMVPFIAAAAVLALGGVTVLGVTMLDMLAKRSIHREGSDNETSRGLRDLDDRMQKLERSQKDLRKKLDFVSAIANKLYAARPLTETEKELAKLYTLPPDELLRQGLHAERTGKERPGKYYEVLLDNYPDSQHAPTALLYLGALRTRLGDYGEAVKPLRAYLDKYESISAYDTARVHYYLAMAVSSLDGKKEAAEHFSKALAGFPKADILRADAHFNLAETYRQLGDRKRAAAEYQAVLDEFAGDRRAADMIKLTEYRLKSLKEGRE
jgi:tetratricopeptide (TPR) repeat protein